MMQIFVQPTCVSSKENAKSNDSDKFLKLGKTRALSMDFLVVHICLQSFVCLFVLEFYGPVNNEVMTSRSVNSGTVPGQA